jgi:DNA-directed RNA polymerase subunit M/transcription elongation factor TFIIS
MPPLSIRCPGCKSTLRVRPELAGKKVKCPKCAQLVPVPAPKEEELVEVTAAEDELEEVEDERPRGKAAKGAKSGKYVPCPQCGATGAKRVKMTWWGSIYGPALFTHVRCPECDYAYNGRTGGSNLIPAILFVAIPLVGILALIGVILYMLHSRGYF